LTVYIIGTPLPSDLSAARALISALVRIKASSQIVEMNIEVAVHPHRIETWSLICAAGSKLEGQKKSYMYFPS